MKSRTPSLLAITFLIAGPASAQSLGERLSGLPRPAESRRPRPEVVIDDTRSSSFMFALAGNVAGLNGTYFRSDVALVNNGTAAEPVTVYWLAAGQNNCTAQPAFTATLNAGTVHFLRDFVGQQLQQRGVGAISVFAGPPGALDAAGRIDGMSRLWTPTNFGGTSSMSFPSVSLLDSIGSLIAYSFGLRQDSDFRTNVGVVNLDSVSHVWTVQIFGTSGNNAFTLSVQPCSLTQVALPAGDYGDLFLSFKSDGFGFWWSAYGASVDNTTGDAWSAHASQ